MEIDSFLSYLKNIKRYSALTITAYKEDLNQFREFCEKVELIRQDEEITSKMVRRNGIDVRWVEDWRGGR